MEKKIISPAGIYGNNKTIRIAGKGIMVNPTSHKRVVKAVAMPTATRLILSHFIFFLTGQEAGLRFQSVLNCFRRTGIHKFSPVYPYNSHHDHHGEETLRKCENHQVMAKPWPDADKVEAQKWFEKQINKESAKETDPYPQHQKDSPNVHVSPPSQTDSLDGSGDGLAKRGVDDQF